MTQTERRQFLLRALLDERPAWRREPLPARGEEQRQLLRGLMNVRDFMSKPTSVRKVIFNVFKDLDKARYEQLLGADGAPA